MFGASKTQNLKTMRANVSPIGNVLPRGRASCLMDCGIVFVRGCQTATVWPLVLR